MLVRGTEAVFGDTRRVGVVQYDHLGARLLSEDLGEVGILT